MKVSSVTSSCLFQEEVDVWASTSYEHKNRMGEISTDTRLSAQNPACYRVSGFMLKSRIGMSSSVNITISGEPRGNCLVRAEARHTMNVLRAQLT